MAQTLLLGQNSCGRMTEEIANFSDADQVYQAYIDGYLSGYNVGREGKVNFVAGSDSISRYKFVLNFCDNNPLDRVVVGINKLILKYNKELW